MITTIDKAGRLVLPKTIRDRLRLVPGAEIDLSLEGECVRLTAHTPAASLQSKDGLLVFAAGEHGTAVIDIADFINQQRALPVSQALGG